MTNYSNLGAHELLEIQEVLNSTINGINSFRMYQPYCQDPELKNILQNQLNFMVAEYNAIVNMFQSENTHHLPSPNFNRQFSPNYGLVSSTALPLNQTTNLISDRDVSSGMLTFSKFTALQRMQVTLECSDPRIRSIMLQAANNCADQAYEIWSYMNKKGFYPVPTFDQSQSQKLLNTYQSATNTSVNYPVNQNIETNYQNAIHTPYMGNPHRSVMDYQS